MTDLADIFTELGISHYLHDFIEQGFDTWETILDITESDFDVLGVKLGHRRKLQRKIANSRGVSSDRALGSPRNTPVDDKPDELKGPSTKVDSKDGSIVVGAKRKYRRHPKPDDNAPERPPSAYVIFSNRMREELKGRNLSFTEIAKLVGENWQNLSPEEKEPYEQQASTAKERYNNELAEYKKTEHHREYSQYLAEFKARQSTRNQANDSDPAKRPKLEGQNSSTLSSVSGSSGTTNSQHETYLGRRRVESSGSTTDQWHPTEGTTPISPHIASMPQLTIALGTSKPVKPPGVPSPTILPGYRESFFGSQQLVAWREEQREDTPISHQQLPSLSSVTDVRSALPQNIASHSRNLTESPQHARRTAHGQNNPPPLLTSESTNRSSSSASTVSSNYFTPRTPLESSLERGLLIPSLYPQKSYETPLPPLIPSQSPESTVVLPQPSPNYPCTDRGPAIHTVVDFPPVMPHIRDYASSLPSQNNQLDHRYQEYQSNFIGDNKLDPVSALLMAAENVDRNERNNIDRRGP